jgi:dCTP deaminase
MTFWSSQTLKSHLPMLIKPFNEKHVESAAYELTLGGEVYISPLPDTPSKDRKKVLFKDENDTVSIPPGQFAFLITSEEVSVPINAIAFISMKFGAKAKGLINVSGFHVDPGYKGNLIFAVYNAGPLNFHIQRGQRLFSIWYANLDDDDSDPRKKAGYTTIPTDLMNSPDLVSSLPFLVKRIDDLEKKVEPYAARQAIFWSVLITVSLLVLRPAIDFLSQNIFSGLSGPKPTVVQSTTPQQTLPNNGNLPVERKSPVLDKAK